MTTHNALTARGRRVLNKIDEARREIRRGVAIFGDPNAQRAVELLADAIEQIALTTPDESLWTKESE